MENYKKIVIFSLLLSGVRGMFLVNSNNSLVEESENATSEHSYLNYYMPDVPEPNSSNIVSSDSSEEILSNSSLSSFSVVLKESFPSTQTASDACSCNWKYLKHYLVKGCSIEEYDSCGCPMKYTCPQNNLELVNADVCVYQGIEYGVGSRITTSNECQVCRCSAGDPPYITCITKECFGDYRALGPNCHPVYKESKCCSVGYKCVNDTEETEGQAVEACEYGGVLYPFGSKIYLQDDPCKVCICNENWVNGTSCREHDCLLEQDKPKLDDGCIPVYHEKACCPIEFYCPSSHNFSYSVIHDNETEDAGRPEGDKCAFGDRLYERGAEIPMENPCVTCMCSVPPDFTCVHRSCPQSPDSGSCYPTYIPGQCCPSYDCLMGDAAPMTEGCPTPLCEDSSCHIGIPPGHECPTCICGERVSELEHNSLNQQQVQEIGQELEPFQEVYHGPRVNSNDYSEDELQMMPIRMQDSEGASVLEKIILPEVDDEERSPEEELRELDDISVEGNSEEELSDAALVEGDLVTLEEPFEENEQNETLGVKNSSTIEFNENEGKEKIKRSDITDAPQPKQHEIVYEPFVPQESISHIETEGELEKEGESSKPEGSFDDELESLRKRLFANNNTIINEIISINHEVPVPEGCPTPMCEGNWCKIGILEGHTCPTCICKRKIDSEP